MSTKAAWQAVNHKLMAEQRRAFGDPPSAEQLLAYTRGELPEEQEERVRDLLVCHPALARTVAVPFPLEDETELLSDEELAKQWVMLQRRLHRTRIRGRRGGVVQFPQALTALAAAVALVFAGLYWQAQSHVQQLGGPQVVTDEHLLRPDVPSRGGDPPLALTEVGESLLLVVPVVPEATRVEIVERTPGGERSLWTSNAVPRADQTFAIVVPRGFLAAGEYGVVVYAGEARVGRYSVRVAR
jgi:hypothetical protein